MARSYQGLTDEAVGNQSQSHLSHAIVGKVSYSHAESMLKPRAWIIISTWPGQCTPFVKAAGHSIALPTNDASARYRNENICRFPMSLTQFDRSDRRERFLLVSAKILGDLLTGTILSEYLTRFDQQPVRSHLF